MDVFVNMITALRVTTPDRRLTMDGWYCETICITLLGPCQIFISTQVTFPSQCFWYSPLVNCNWSKILDLLSVSTTDCTPIYADLLLELWGKPLSLTAVGKEQSLPVAYCRRHYCQINNKKLLAFSSAPLVFNVTLLPFSLSLLIRSTAHSLRAHTHTFCAFFPLCVVVFYNRETSFVWEAAACCKNKDCKKNRRVLSLNQSTGHETDQPVLF